MAKPVGVTAPEAHSAADSGLDPDPATSRAIARVGTTLHEKWHLNELLGIGGTAAVYAATHRNGSRAAVKILNPELSLHPQVRERFFREGYAANAVGHSGTVKVLDDDEALDGSLFLVTELLEGESLEQRRVSAGGRLPEEEVLRLSDQLLDVIAAAHAKGIVHRDLKPENVFLTRSGQLKVLDFGIAALRELSSSQTRTGTITGAVMGTPAYMPPEQALGLWDTVDALSDLWAWGATMFHLLSGEVVHDGRTLNEQLSKAMTGSATPLAWVAPEISPVVAHIVDRALERERNERWPDAQSMQEAIRAAYLERVGSPMTTLPGLSAPPSSLDGERRSMPTFRATALPVETTPSVPPPNAAVRRKRTGIAIGAAVALATLGTCAHSIVAGRGPGSAADPASLASPPVVSVAEPPVVTVPELAPSPPEPAEAAAPLPAIKKPPVASGVPSGTVRPPKAPASQACTPPYVVNSETGKRRWKLECL